MRENFIQRNAHLYEKEPKILAIKWMNANAAAIFKEFGHKGEQYDGFLAENTMVSYGMQEGDYLVLERLGKEDHCYCMSSTKLHHKYMAIKDEKPKASSKKGK